ncbi:hypothetical protein CJ179_00510 [Rhodococcus sp. ACS1]|nr:hypothetical protein CJ179_00510 [Rhodococcus sp. ACS1]
MNAQDCSTTDCGGQRSSPLAATHLVPRLLDTIVRAGGLEAAEPSTKVREVREVREAYNVSPGAPPSSLDLDGGKPHAPVNRESLT